jgi:HSP20 family protein
MTTMVEPFPAWLRDLNRIFTAEGGAGTQQFAPPADVLVDDEGVTVHMDLPGMRAENLEIELENDILTVRGERPYPYRSDNGDSGVRRVERAFGRFERALRVPRGLDPDSIQASLVDGVLTLRIPKPEQMKPRRIEVKAGESTEQREIEGAAH